MAIYSIKYFIQSVHYFYIRNTITLSDLILFLVMLLASLFFQSEPATKKKILATQILEDVLLFSIGCFAFGLYQVFLTMDGNQKHK